ncbi:MAG: hypothetical protein E7C49_19395 [Clostridium sp.]|nr:hypothetical protein [Clostridium sp.]
MINAIEFTEEFETYGYTKIMTVIPITLGGKIFEVHILDKEAEKFYKRFSGCVGESEYNIADSIIALKKLVKILELSLDVIVSE